MDSLTDPETGEAYTRDELDRFYLFHVISGGDISMGFPFDMQLDTPDGKFEEFIASLPEVAQESGEKSEMAKKGYEIPPWLK